MYFTFRGFGKEFDSVVDGIVGGTIKLHMSIVNKMVAEVDKEHYQFTMRDFSRVIQGVLLSTPEAIKDKQAMEKLWAHEVITYMC